MAFELERVVPWGRGFGEYERMFALSGADLRGRVLGCADGPASFNAEASKRGIAVVSCDPLYRFGVEEIRTRVKATGDQVLEEPVAIDRGSCGASSARSTNSERPARPENFSGA